MSNKIMSLVERYWIPECCYTPFAPLVLCFFMRCVFYTLSTPLGLGGIYDSLGEAKGV